MTMFPSIRMPAVPKPTVTVKRISTKPEDGPVMSRPAWTCAERRFEVSWPQVSDGERATVEAFFAAHSCDAVEWMHPVSQEVLTVVFDPSIEKLEFVPLGLYIGGLPVWSFSVTFLEV